MCCAGRLEVLVPIVEGSQLCEPAIVGVGPLADRTSRPGNKSEFVGPFSGVLSKHRAPQADIYNYLFV